MCYTPELLRHSSWAAESSIRLGKEKTHMGEFFGPKVASDAALPAVRNFEEIKTIDTVKN